MILREELTRKIRISEWKVMARTEYELLSWVAAQFRHYRRGEGLMGLVISPLRWGGDNRTIQVVRIIEVGIAMVYQHGIG